MVAATSAPSADAATSPAAFACTIFFELKNEKSAIYRLVDGRWVKVVGPPRLEVGSWRRVVAAPNRNVLLAQWSGACEIESTYLVSVASGTARPVLEGLASTAVGWAPDRQARVLLPAAGSETRSKRILEPGIYRVDPETLAATLEQAVSARHGC